MIERIAGPVIAICFTLVCVLDAASCLGEETYYEWVNVTNSAAYAPRDGAGALVYNDKMWLIGGWNPADAAYFPWDCSNDVWSSTDGANWTMVKPQTFRPDEFDSANDWEGRHTAGYVVHQDKMWIVGGDPLQGHYQPDVWNSSDGANWTHVNNGSPTPWGQRCLQHTTAFDGKIWVMGGQTVPQYVPGDEHFYNDVWNSTDGVNWTQVTTEGPMWEPRGQIGGNVVFNGRMWILGGGTYNTPGSPTRNYYNDVWSSADGVHWDKHLDNAPWASRQYHEVAVYDGKMWGMEGWDGTSNRRDVWYSDDGVNWTEVPNTPWNPRHAASVYTYDNALWMVAGNNMERDVWKLVPGDPPVPLPAGTVNFESPRYTTGSDVVGHDGWSDYLGATTSVTPDAAGSNDMRVLEGSQSLRLGGSRSIIQRNFGQGTVFDHGTTLSVRMMLSGPVGGQGEFHFSHNQSNLATPAGIVAKAGGNFFVFGFKNGGLETGDGSDTGVAVVADVDYLLELVLDLSNQSFESYVTNLTDDGPRTSLGVYNFALNGGDSVDAADVIDSGYVLITRSSAVGIFDELKVMPLSVPYIQGDANGDGKVDDADASLLATNWQETSGVNATVPEPTLAVSLFGLLLGYAAVRRINNGASRTHHITSNVK